MTGVQGYQGRRIDRHRMLRAALYPDRTNMGQRVAMGTAWVFGLVGTRIVLTILSTSILARLLTPTDFGLNGMAAIIVEIAALLTNLGFGPILIQKPKLNRLSLDTAFWVSTGTGGALALIIVAIAYPASLFFSQPELIPILCVAGLNFVVQEANVVPSAILNRLLKFKAEVLIQLLQIVIRIALAILIAWMGGGYWSLVLAPIIAGAIGTAINLWYVGYIPRLRFDNKFARSNWRASGSYLGSGLISHLLSNFDYMLVGRRFGAEQLGFYQTAFSLPEELRSRFSGPLQRVLMPTYSLMQADTGTFRVAFLRSIKLFSTAMLPMGFGMAATADLIVPLLYGEQWLPVIPLLKILALGGALRAVFSLTASVFAAKGVPQMAFKIQLVGAPLVLGLVYAGSHYGVMGVAWGMLVAQLTGLLSVPFAMILLEGKFFDFIRAIFSPLLASGLMFIALTSEDTLRLTSNLTQSTRLALMIVIGVLIYVTVWMVLERRFAIEMAVGLRRYWRR